MKLKAVLRWVKAAAAGSTFQKNKTFIYFL
jgi:hypothetical protein